MRPAVRRPACRLVQDALDLGHAGVAGRPRLDGAKRIRPQFVQFVPAYVFHARGLLAVDPVAPARCLEARVLHEDRFAVIARPFGADEVSFDFVTHGLTYRDELRDFKPCGVFVRARRVAPPLSRRKIRPPTPSLRGLWQGRRPARPGSDMSRHVKPSTARTQAGATPAADPGTGHTPMMAQYVGVRQRVAQSS